MAMSAPAASVMAMAAMAAALVTGSVGCWKWVCCGGLWVSWWWFGDVCAHRIVGWIGAAAAEGGGGCVRGFEEVCSVVGPGRSACVEGAVEVRDWRPGVACGGK